MLAVMSKLRRSEGFNVFELKGRGGRAGILYFVVLLLLFKTSTLYVRVWYCPSFGEVRAAVFFELKGRGGPAGILYFVVSD
jgi:hypothetical protein